MDKKVVNVTSLISGIVTAVVALFFLIAGIITFTDFSFDAQAKINIYISISAALQFVAAAGLGVFGYFIIKDYLSKTENKKWTLFAACLYFLFVAIAVFVVMCFFSAFNSGRNWAILIIAIAGLVVSILALVGKFSGTAGKVVDITATVIGFVLAIIQLVNAGGFGIAVDIFVMIMFVVYFLYYLFDIMASGDFKTTESKAE